MKLLIAILMLAQGAVYAGGLEKADQAFSKKLYQEALAAYSPALKSGGDEGLKALYRCAECEALLLRYGEAAQRLSDMKLPDDPLWRGRFLLLRAEAGRQFLARYGYSLPADEQKGTSDVTKLTRAQWESRVSSDYDALWPLRSELLKYRLETQDYFVDTRNAELAYTPTLWDFAVLRWTDYLLSGEDSQGARPDAGLFVLPGYEADYTPSAPPAAKAAAIYEEAAGAGRGEADFAREYWKFERLLIPFSHPDKVSISDETKLRSAALDTLTGWAGSFKTPLTRAWALYQSAVLNQQKPDFKAAVDLCARVEGEAKGSRPAALCAQLRAGIEMPELELSASFAPPPGKGILKLNVRNLPAVYFRAYRTTPEELASMGTYNGQAWERLRYLQPETVKTFLSRKPDLEWTAGVTYTAPYAFREETPSSPAFKKGIYVVLASGDDGFEEGSSLMKAVTVNITDIFLLGTAGVSGDPENFLYDPRDPSRTLSADLFRFYSVDAVTGRPLAGAPIDAWFNKSGSDWQKTRLAAGPDGMASFAFPLSVSFPLSQYFSVDPLLSYGGAYAYWNSQDSSGFDVPRPLNVFVETDRPVYRPGQDVKFKATVLARLPRGFRAYSGKAKIKVTARDANWQEVYSKELPVTGLGSVAGSFTVPGACWGVIRLLRNCANIIAISAAQPRSAWKNTSARNSK
jgi:hypothetical protein